MIKKIALSLCLFTSLSASPINDEGEKKFLTLHKKWTNETCCHFSIETLKTNLQKEMPQDFPPYLLQKTLRYGVENYIRFLSYTAREMILINNAYICPDYKRLENFYDITDLEELEIIRDFNKSFETNDFGALEYRIHSIRHQIDEAFSRILRDLKQPITSSNTLKHELQHFVGGQHLKKVKASALSGQNDLQDILIKAFQSRRTAMEGLTDKQEASDNDEWDD